jgi:hypothetical protein
MSHTQRSFCFWRLRGFASGEAVEVKRSDFDGDTLRVRRRIYEGKADTTKTKKSARDLPIPDALRSRLFSIGGREWIFESQNSTPVNLGNVLKRYVRLVVRSLGDQDRRLARFQAHAEQHCVNTDGPRKSEQIFSDIQACRLRVVCTITRTRTIFARRSAKSHLGCYEMFRNRELQIRKLLNERPET